MQAKWPKPITFYLTQLVFASHTQSDMSHDTFKLAR